MSTVNCFYFFTSLWLMPTLSSWFEPNFAMPIRADVAEHFVFLEMLAVSCADRITILKTTAPFQTIDFLVLNRQNCFYDMQLWNFVYCKMCKQKFPRDIQTLQRDVFAEACTAETLAVDAAAQMTRCVCHRIPLAFKRLIIIFCKHRKTELVS